MERQMIIEYGTLYPDGYNLTTGGEATWGRRVTEEARARMSAAAKARDPLTRKISTETKKKMSLMRSNTLAARPDLRRAIGDFNRGKTRTAEQRRQISASLKLWYESEAAE